MQKGKFIVIEGTDGSGKETQARKLIERLEQEEISCAYMTFPTYGTASGDIVGDCYLGKGHRIDAGSWFGEADAVNPRVASHYFAANRLDTLPKIRSLLEKGVNIICDRYVESNMAHQGGKIKNPKERREFIDWIESLEYGLNSLPKPDLLVFLHMPYDRAIQLRKIRDKKQGISENLDGHETCEQHLRNAEECYLELAEMFDWNKIYCDKEGKMPKTPKEIHSEVYGIVRDFLGIKINR